MDMSFEAFTQLYEKDIRPRLKENTWLTKEHIIKTKILPYFGKRNISEITTKDVIAWQNELLAYRNEKRQPYSQTYLKTVHILVGHLNKMQGTKANYRGLGSVDFQATARSVLVVGRVKDSPETRVMAHQKSSLAPEGEPIAFELNKETGFHWIGHYDISIDDLLSGFSRQKKSEMAESLITDCLAEGKCPQQVIQQKAESMGISKRILDTVKKSLDVQSIKIGSKWYWQLAA